MTPDQIIAARVEAHRQRVQAELAALPRRPAGVKSSRRKPEPPKPSWCKVWAAKVERINRMFRNPGWSLALLLLAAPAAGNDPPPEPVFERVDLLEVNHFYDEQGRLVFDQAIFYDYCPRAERFQVRAWRLIKCKAQLPFRDWQHGGWTALWLDGEVLRQVRALDYRESWSQYDPELVERKHLPKERRRELITVKVDEPSGAELPLPRPPLP